MTFFFLRLKFCEKFAVFCSKTLFCRLPEILWKICNFRAKTFFYLFIFFGEHLHVVTLILGLGLWHSFAWPRENLSSESRSLAFDFFCVLGLEPCVLDSTSALYVLRRNKHNALSKNVYIAGQQQRISKIRADILFKKYKLDQ